MAVDWVVAAGVVVGASALLWAFSALMTRRIETAVPINGRFVEVEGERFHYVDEGKGPPLVMIHGLMGSSRNLTYALSGQLRERFRVITLDRLGSGYSTRHAGTAADLPAQARQIAAFIKTLDLDKPLVLGHSLGGAIALALALDHPHAVSGLILVAPLTHPQRLLPWVFLSLAVRPAWLRRWVSHTLTLPIGLLTKGSVVKGVFAPDPAPADFATRGGGLLGMRPDNFYAASTEINTVNVHLPEMVKRYAQLTLPIGLMYGARDKVLDFQKHGQALASKVPGLKLQVVEGRGHMLPITATERVAAVVEQVAKRVRPPQNATLLHPPFALASK
ncbi:alpha/beta fold hydrolase [Pseudomonas tolaasii]|uniref:alpha/beta fold hydrolase n=1 Tax=Pseudomonas tolaasii TaxID=29442 RepID=UPI0003085456|nr:alpha/beta hydrolase [Pseudomonas tolaasii]NVZ47481.1 alpha/beta hydrolase [Pseudomonas tolaasii]NWA46942.1 alpha/beta hydrolase [Pseudomonas tolaasii]NWC27417.1 alpha/beta hydrolase [Pseudomonas tolaasii]NWC53431.1 alpha/beta hydrolase [Pseudomonas tolaasii]NWE61710.1 alpha/beta hydrolase [Pseudomonas tolaasii]